MITSAFVNRLPVPGSVFESNLYFSSFSFPSPHLLPDTFSHQHISYVRFSIKELNRFIEWVEEGCMKKKPNTRMFHRAAGIGLSLTVFVSVVCDNVSWELLQILSIFATLKDFFFFAKFNTLWTQHTIIYFCPINQIGWP